MMIPKSEKLNSIYKNKRPTSLFLMTMNRMKFPNSNKSHKEINIKQMIHK